ncbi:MAG: FprA family A-type flavoprotein [Methanolinea sp.]|nr:FprA family A-type flavoprotein [Methanolinea sp.]
MAVHEIAPDIFAIGALDFDRRLFDGLIPLPQGTSYNSYLVRGKEKTALIDTVDPSRELDLVTNLVKSRVEKVDYIVVNHAEQDHSGSLPMMAELFPTARILVSEKCLDLVVHLLDIDPARCTVVSEQESIDLGGKTLQFFMAPWVHWPETMLTFAVEDGVLFSCDLFGTHMAESTLTARDKVQVYHSAKRYFAEIMMPFRKNISEHMEKIKDLPLKTIAPSHGPVYSPPDLILDAYRDWISDRVSDEVVIPYVSMHGSTEKMVNHLVEALIARGIRATPYNLPVTDIGELAMSLVDAATVVIGTPTLLFGPHPQAVYATYLFNLLKPKTRFVAIIGSYGWGGKTVETLQGMMTRVHPEVLDPVYIKGAPGTGDLKLIESLADTIEKKHREIGIHS